MRLRPFVPHAPIEDITDDANRHYSDLNAVDDQILFKDNLPEFERPTPAELTNETEVNEAETLDSEHGTIYYEPPLPNLYRKTPEQKTHNTPNTTIHLIQ